MAAKRTRTVGRLRWLRLTTGERITTCARFWLVPYGRSRVWWLYMREHGGDLRITSWRLVYRSHKLQLALVAASVCTRAYSGELDEVSIGAFRRRVDTALALALDGGELVVERFDDAVASRMRLWGAA